MLVPVLRQMAVGGATSSTRESRAAREISASAAVTSPGAMAPPTNSPRSSTQSKLVAVPKSTTMTGAPYSATAATALQTRAARPPRRPAPPPAPRPPPAPAAPAPPPPRAAGARGGAAPAPPPRGGGGGPDRV